MKSPFLPLRAIFTTAACAVLTATSFAQAPAPGTPPAPGAPGTPAAPGAPAATPAPKPLSPTEKNFVKSAYKSAFYLKEVASAGKTAITDPGQVRVRDTSIKDLTTVLGGLNKLAVSHGDKEIVGELTGADKSDIERLGKLKDDKFVKQWVEFLQKESKKLDRDFEAAGKSSQDPDFKTFVSNYGPSVRNVFTSSEALEKALSQKKK